jgi:hypothetical protein
MKSKSEINRGIEDVYKFNIMELAKHHRKYCEGEDCVISLYLLREMTERLGIVFTEKEKELFL